jgi:hypothetical protein
VRVGDDREATHSSEDPLEVGALERQQAAERRTACLSMRKMPVRQGRAQQVTGTVDVHTIICIWRIHTGRNMCVLEREKKVSYSLGESGEEGSLADLNPKYFFKSGFGWGGGSS